MSQFQIYGSPSLERCKPQQSLNVCLSGVKEVEDNFADFTQWSKFYNRTWSDTFNNVRIVCANNLVRYIQQCQNSMCQNFRSGHSGELWFPKENPTIGKHQMTPECNNFEAIFDSNVLNGNKAFLNAASGHDTIVGFLERSNVISFSGGNKYFIGGNRPDTFLPHGVEIAVGFIDGGGTLQQPDTINIIESQNRMCVYNLAVELYHSTNVWNQACSGTFVYALNKHSKPGTIYGTPSLVRCTPQQSLNMCLNGVKEVEDNFADFAQWSKFYSRIWPNTSNNITVICTNARPIENPRNFRSGHSWDLWPSQEKSFMGNDQMALECTNFEAIFDSNIPNGNKAFLKAASGNDRVVGFVERSNVISFNGGNKYFLGGNKPDTFILHGEKIAVGFIDGGEGSDTLDFSNYAKSELPIKFYKAYKTGHYLVVNTRVVGYKTVPMIEDPYDMMQSLLGLYRLNAILIVEDEVNQIKIIIGHGQQIANAKKAEQDMLNANVLSNDLRFVYSILVGARNTENIFNIMTKC
uniref:Uncharacterized protein n=1 Tax=Romanomermis culicivorax TaxID=13658 RepID=A0A915J4R6_ROMCU